MKVARWIRRRRVNTKSRPCSVLPIKVIDPCFFPFALPLLLYRQNVEFLWHLSHVLRRHPYAIFKHCLGKVITPIKKPSGRHIIVFSPFPCRSLINEPIAPQPIIPTLCLAKLIGARLNCLLQRTEPMKKTSSFIDELRKVGLPQKKKSMGI